MASETAAPSGRLLEWIKAIGMPLVTLLITVLGGFYFTNLTKEREARHNNQTLYAQLVTQREQSDAQIRKDMFGVVFKEFLDTQKEQVSANRVLQLELLANNFSQSLDLAPLFKDLARRLDSGDVRLRANHLELKKRLDLAASNLVFKQVNSLSQRGFVAQETVSLADWEASFGKPVVTANIDQSSLLGGGAVIVGTGGTEDVRFSVEIVGVSIERREVEVRLIAQFPGKDKDIDKVIDRHFWVGAYDFPMLDNLQLPHGLRVSVVTTEFFVPEIEADRAANSFVNLHLVVFPASSASLKERQDYDDILRDMLRTRQANDRLSAR